MASFDWETFEWNLSRVVSGTRPTIPPFVFRRAEVDERDVVEKVVLSAFSMEPALADRSKSLAAHIQEACDAGFTKTGTFCMVVQHGTRIIGASIVNPDPDAENHLVTGPAILHEYRSRGIGSTLLFHTLDLLNDCGLEIARGRVRALSTAARYVYPKFDGTVSPLVAQPDLDAPQLA